MNLKAIPFYLNDDDIEWVYNTLSHMSDEEKVGQLFCLAIEDCSCSDILDGKFSVCVPGGIMYRPNPLDAIVSFSNTVNGKAAIPLLIAANLENGGSGVSEDGSVFGVQLQVSATDDVLYSKYLASVCSEEGMSMGVNWNFAPVVDLDLNYLNPLTNKRTFGSDTRRVAEMSEAYLKTIQSMGMASAIKHFPGDGFDSRAQHKHPTINGLTIEGWDETYGVVYRKCIDAGVLSVMVGHILMPEYSRKLNDKVDDTDILPASLAPELMDGLLRKKLGFNGLIVTDSTLMAGFSALMPRKTALPYSIASGADMLLFARNFKEDFNFVRDGLKNGLITKERLDEAVTRILALKAALKLHRHITVFSAEHAREKIAAENHKFWAQECAAKAVTLVKEETGVLPITPKRYPRILYFPVEPDYSEAGNQFEQILADEGFLVHRVNPDLANEGLYFTNSSVYASEHYDLILYLMNVNFLRSDLAQPGVEFWPHYLTEIPTVMVSVACPYHLSDYPRLCTYINAYHSSIYALNAVVDRLMGRMPFTGVSPSDPFCGKWDTKLQLPKSYRLR